MWKRIRCVVGWISFVIILVESTILGFVAYSTHANNPSTETQKLSGPGPLFSVTSTVSSGFFINDSGEILTNRHAVNSCRRISVAGAGFHGVRGKVLAISDVFDRDLAVVRIPIKHSTVAEFLDPMLSHGEDLDGIPGPFVLVGFPGADRGVTPAIQKMITVKLRHMNGTKEMFIEAEGPNERGDSGSPLFDGSGRVVGIWFAGSGSIKDLYSQIEISETGVAIYTPNVIDWLKKSGIAFSISNDYQPSEDKVLATSAVVNVFCFK